MQDRTLQMIELALGGDLTVSPGQRVAVLALCRNPFVSDDSSPLGAELCLSIRDAAGVLGVSHRTVQRWVAAGTLGSRRLMGRRYVPRLALRRLLDGQGESQVPLRFPTDRRQSAYGDEAAKAG